MSRQRFTPVEREAIWLAHNKKCAYTGELLDVCSFHIDHILPERLAEDHDEFAIIKKDMGIPDDFSLFGYENVLPCRQGANLQKAGTVFCSTPYYLGIAHAKKNIVERNLKDINKRLESGKALIMLQQCLYENKISYEEASLILTENSEFPENVFKLIEPMWFADASEEVRFIAKADLDVLCERPIRLGENEHIYGIILSKAGVENIHVRTCREYEEALGQGYEPYTNVEIKMSVFFKHQCGLLKYLRRAASPAESFISEPRVGVVDLALLPFSLFPWLGDPDDAPCPASTYQSKVDEGELIVKKARHNVIQVETGGMGQQLVEVARADFTGDGLEDILLFESYHVTTGTLGGGGVRLLTRKTPDGLFEEITIDS